MLWVPVSSFLISCIFSLLKSCTQWLLGSTFWDEYWLMYQEEFATPHFGPEIFIFDRITSLFQFKKHIANDTWCNLCTVINLVQNKLVERKFLMLAPTVPGNMVMRASSMNLFKTFVGSFFVTLLSLTLCCVGFNCFVAFVGGYCQHSTWVLELNQGQTKMIFSLKQWLNKGLLHI